MPYSETLLRSYVTSLWWNFTYSCEYSAGEEERLPEAPVGLAGRIPYHTYTTIVRIQDLTHKRLQLLS